MRFLLWLPLFVVTLVAAPLAWADVEVPPSARDTGAHVQDHPQAEVKLLSEFEQIRPGDEFRVGILFRLEDDWHIYWENPGDAGLPTQIDWSAPGLSFTPLQWAVPGVYPEAGGEFITFGYDGEVLLFSRAFASDEVDSEIELTANIEYMACRNECLHDEHQLSRTITVGENPIPASDEVLRLFDDYAMQVPQLSEAVGIEARAERRGDDEVVLDIVLCDGDQDQCPEMELVDDRIEFAFVTTADSDVDVEPISVESHPTAPLGWQIGLSIRAEEPVEPLQLGGVIRLDDGYGSILPIRIAVAIHESDGQTGESSADDTPDPEPDDAPLPLFYVLLLAFVGGMILNLMPCVFPVLAIKVSAFTELVHEDRSGIFANAAAYTGGISASLLALGLVVVGLRLGGTQVGWGFQFQQPMFLVALSIIIVLFALNTFDIFQVSMRSGNLAEAAESSTGLRRSFAEGILAVVLATPCSAPFLGTAVGFALTAHALTILLIFFVLGLGLASPFVALTLLPGASRFMPKPGPWMGHLKKFLGFALLAAAIWLVWLVGRLAGVDAMAQILALLGAISLATWLFGIVQYRSWDRTKALTVAVALLIAGTAAILTLPIDSQSAPERPSASVEEGTFQWLTWDRNAVEAELAEGRAVFVNFTADWCLTCKTNERTTLSDDAVRQAAVANDIAMFVADWTHPDEAIRAEIESYGKGGVPMYLYYRPGDSEPEVLSEVLTPGMLINRFEAHR